MADAAEIEPASLPTEADEAEDAGSLFEDLRDLAEDAQTAVEAEVQYQSARAGYALGEIRDIATWLTLALVAAIIALFTLATGLLLGLAPLIGPWAATGVVVLALLAIAGSAALVAIRGIRRLKRNAFPATIERKP
ncbi:MAG: phage holin family protein [Novosphingobium sp.]|nr:phage holin family protein [Novosphingobium sp.]